MTIHIPSLVAFVRAMFYRPRPNTGRDARVCRVEEAANVRAYYGLDRDDFALWEQERSRRDA